MLIYASCRMKELHHLLCTHIKKSKKLWIHKMKMCLDTYSLSLKAIWQGSQTLTANSKPIDGIVILPVEHFSHIALPQNRQWCWRKPSCLWSTMARKFQKNGRAQSWHKPDSPQTGVSCRGWLISQKTITPSSPPLISCLVLFEKYKDDTCNKNNFLTRLFYTAKYD